MSSWVGFVDAGEAMMVSTVTDGSPVLLDGAQQPEPWLPVESFKGNDFISCLSVPAAGSASHFVC